MAKYYCEECGTEMELNYEDRIILCPNCGRNDDISEEDMEDFEGRTSEDYCNICEHSDEYPSCKSKCPYEFYG